MFDFNSYGRKKRRIKKRENVSVTPQIQKYKTCLLNLCTNKTEQNCKVSHKHFFTIHLSLCIA